MEVFNTGYIGVARGPAGPLFSWLYTKPNGMETIKFVHSTNTPKQS